MTARIPLLAAAFLFAACALPSSKGKILFIPDSAQSNQQEQPGLSSSWQIIESQSGHGEDGLPAWVRSYLNGGVRRIETLDAYHKYVFIGRNRGNNFNALQQWANGFTAAQDLPRLIVQRVERRLLAAAVLYPDDEYGEYFAHMIKRVSDEEYPGAVKESIFWTKQKRIQSEAETAENADLETPPENAVVEHAERYEFLILFSIDREAFQAQIQNIMTDIKTTTAPTRDQTTAINKIRQTFFEGF
jgi:hypothetical protein